MKREEKHRLKKERAARRRSANKKRNDFRTDNWYVPTRAARQIAKKGYADPWYDSSSPTGYSQVCSYRGTCQSPCNGDC